MHTELIPEAIKLLIVGMVTVFLILVIVIYLGKTLIWAVNKWAPEEEVAKKGSAPKAVAAVDATVKAVIDATVSQITGGKGRATKITKL